MGITKTMGKIEKGRCGLCCTLLVRLSHRDIDQIKKTGVGEDFFVGHTSRGELVLRRINNYCRFIMIEDGIATCTIYESRPKICREYVCIGKGESECRLQRHYSVVQLGKAKEV
jgi:Fe-S-cluster containining protein